MSTLCNRLFPLALSALVFTGCKADEKKIEDRLAPVAAKIAAEAKAEAEKVVESKSVTEPPPVDVATRFKECWAAYNQHDETTFKQCYQPTATFELVNGDPPRSATGPEEILAVAKDYWQAFPDIHSEAQLVLINGTNVAAIMHTSATNTGSIRDMAPTGKSLAMFQGQVVSMSPQGQVMRDEHWIDQGTVLHQLGIRPRERAPSSDKAWDKPIWVVAQNTEEERTNLLIAKALEEKMRMGDERAFMDRVADDISFRYAGDKDAMMGMPAYKKGYKMWSEMAEFESRPQAMWAAGDWVVAVRDSKATLKKDMQGAPGSKGKSVVTKQLEFMRFADGKLKTHWVFENSAAYASQLGMMAPMMDSKLAPKSAPKSAPKANEVRKAKPRP